VCRYLVARSDLRFTQAVATATVTEFLATIPTPQQDSSMSYCGLDAISGVQVLLLHCDSAGNYAYYPDRPPPEHINRVELVCSCYHPERDHAWEAIADRIAAFLGWEVIDDQTDEVLWPRPGSDTTTALL
jgi:hypothetical protein